MLYDWDDISAVYVLGKGIDWEVLYSTTPTPPPPPVPAFLEFGTGLGEYYERKPRPKDTSPRVNPTQRERVKREEDEILIL